MTNPYRPAYGQTIEESWGQAVADTVVRTYPDTATRDADLSGFSATDLAGQVVAITPAGGMASLQYHDGTQWQTIPSGAIGGKITQTGNQAVTAQVDTMFASPCWSQGPQWGPAALAPKLGPAGDGLLVPLAGTYRVFYGVPTINGAANAAFAGGNDLSIMLKLGPAGAGGQNWALVRTRQMSGFPAMAGSAIGALAAGALLRLFVNSSQAGTPYYIDPANGNKMGSYIAAEFVSP